MGGAWVVGGEGRGWGEGRSRSWGIFWIVVCGCWVWSVLVEVARSW